MATIQLPNGWKPRPYQLPLWSYLENGGKRAVEVAHRRWGKDDLALHWAAVSAHERVAPYWHMLPEASQARKAIWEAVNPHTGRRRIDEAFPVELREVTRENEMFIRFKIGSTWQVIGSDNYNSLVGSSPAGITYSEYALADPASWAYLRPILAENGGWALFITTSRGNNHAKSLYDAARKDAGWFAELSDAEKTGVFTPEQLARELREYITQFGEELGRALYEQEYLCSFNSVQLGAFYARLLDDADKAGRIGRVPHDPGLQTYTAWDLGKRDLTAIWFCQYVGKEIRIIDYYEAAGQELPHYAKVLKEKPYVYAEHYLPHDVSHELLGMPKTRAQQLESMGLKIVAGKQLGVEDGIAAVRRLLPQCWFDAEKCKRGLDALRQYRQQWDEDLKTFRGSAVHDWSSHGADAFRELAVNLDPRPASTWKQPAAAKWVV